MPRPAKQPAQDDAFLAPYVGALATNGVEAIPLRVEPRLAIGGERPDAWLRLRGPWGETDWACEVKYRIERGTIGPVIHRMKELQTRVDRALLLTEHVTPPLAEDLRKHDVAFVDAAGNAFLQDKGLFVWVTHRRPKPMIKGEARGLHAAGLKLLYVILRQRARGRNLRELAGDAGIALGGVARILRELERRAWIRRLRDGVELQDAVAMLKRWDEGYADTLRPKLFLRACRRKPGNELERLPQRIAATELRDKILIGGELGAALLTRNLRPEAATLHLDDVDPIQAMRHLDLLPDPRGDVFLLQAFGRMNRAMVTKQDDAALADPLLIRGELLLRPDDRLRELAETLRADHIAPRWT